VENTIMSLDGLLKVATRVNAVTELQQLNRGGNRLSRQASEEIPAAPATMEAPQPLPRHDRFKDLLQQGSANTHQQIERLAGRFTKLTDTKRSLPSMGNLWWSLKLWTQGLGVAGVIGLGLCAFAVMFYFSAVLVLEEEQAQVLEELETSQLLVQRGAPSPTTVPRTPSEQLSDFYAVFPPAKAVPETLRKINQLAERQNLVLRAGNYHVTDDHAGRLVRYEVSFPITGPYPNVRQFMRTVLAEIPSVALDKVDVQKNMSEGAHAKTTVSFTLFSRRDG
jgi:hypothetical protein